MSDSFYAAMDSETGSLDPASGDLLTFYVAVLNEEFKIMEELDLKLKPDGGRNPIAEAGALRVNKIDIQAHMKDANTITYSEGKVKIIALLKKYHKKRGKYNNIRVLGQNVMFDIGYVQHYILPKSEWNQFFHYSTVDTKTICDFLKDAEWFPKTLGTLESISDYFQLPKRNMHNAREDTLTCIEVYKKYLELMKSKKDGGNTQDLISLLEEG